MAPHVVSFFCLPSSFLELSELCCDTPRQEPVLRDTLCQEMRPLLRAWLLLAPCTPPALCWMRQRNPARILCAACPVRAVKDLPPFLNCAFSW